MTSSGLTFDRLTYIDRLKEAGVDDRRAPTPRRWTRRCGTLWRRKAT